MITININKVKVGWIHFTLLFALSTLLFTSCLDVTEPTDRVTEEQMMQAALKALSQELGIPEAHAYSVATFYENFSFDKKGKYVI